MLGWLWRMIVGRFGFCEHHWVQLNDYTLNGSFGSRGHRYHVQCDKCGWIKKIDLI